MKTILSKLLLSCLLLPISILAQTVSGVVTDESKMPMPGVNVIIKGTAKGASTDFDGKFTLSKLKKGDVIEFSYVGYTTKDIVYDNQKTINVVLTEDSQQLKEVVLVSVGYGTVKKKDATGAVTQLSAKEFNKGANVTAENLLNGRVAGLTINTSGAPGSGSEIRIRGGSSLSAKNDPLIVIDGLPIDNNSGTGSTSILSSLNPNTIESFSVLKDASATAIYGSRASNGVIIITTKKGGKKLAVDFNTQYGSGHLVKKIGVFGADQYRDLIAGPFTDHDDNDDTPQIRVGGIGTEDQKKLLGNANTDWQDEIYRRTDFVDTNLSIRGNLFNKIPSRLTLGNTYQEGLRLTNYMNRNNASVTINPSFFDDHLKLRLNANYSIEKNRFTDGVEGAALRFDPTKPVYDKTSYYGGFFEYYDRNAANFDLLPNTIRNPVAQLLQTFDIGSYKRLFGNFELDYKFHFLPELRAVVNVGYDEGFGERSKLVGKNAATSFTNNNIAFGTNENTTSYKRNRLFDGYFAYNKTFGNVVIDATAGYSYQSFESSKYLTGNILNPTISDPASGFPRNEVDTDVVLIGYFARTNFNFKDKYLLTMSIRRDGSSRFSPEERWGYFPAAALAWKVKEDFFKESKSISDLKLRIGWGVTGQQDIDAANDYLQQINIGSGSSQYYFGSSSYPIAVTKRLSPNLKWEETTTYNVGIDYGFFDNRLNGTIEAFYKESTDLLIDAIVSPGANFSNFAWQNIGAFTTKGIEFNLNYDVVKSDNVNWNINFNATSFVREITDIGDSASGIQVGENLAGTGTQGQIHLTGFAPASYYVYKQLYDPSGKPIDGAFADLNGDGQINASDRYLYKNADPKLILGFASNFNYKNLDFSFQLRSNIGNSVLNAVDAKNSYYDMINPNSSLAIANLPTSVLDREFKQSSDRTVLSDINVENASFVRLDNVTLGYTFPKWLDSKASLRLTAGCQNVFVITKYSGLDPEIVNRGVDNTIYPRQRTYLFGANIKF